MQAGRQTDRQINRQAGIFGAGRHIVHLFIFYFFVSFLLIMTFDLKAQPASISSAICGLRRIIIVFSFFFKLIKWKWKMEVPEGLTLNFCGQ